MNAINDTQMQDRILNALRGLMFRVEIMLEYQDAGKTVVLWTGKDKISEANTPANCNALRHEQRRCKLLLAELERRENEANK